MSLSILYGWIGMMEIVRGSMTKNDTYHMMHDLSIPRKRFQKEDTFLFEEVQAIDLIHKAIRV